MSIAEIKDQLPRLTNAQRIELLNAIWESIDHKDEMESPAWHFEALAVREREIESGGATFLSLDDVKTSLSRL